MTSVAPQSLPALLSRATRAKTLPVMLSPVAVGATLALHRDVGLEIPASEGVFGVRPASFALGWFLLTLAGAACLHLGANVLNDYFDERSGADKIARLEKHSIATGSGLIASGAMTGLQMLVLAAALFSASLAAGIALAIARGWLVLVLGAAGALLAWQYVAPPVRYGYRGHGLGEIGIFLAFGALPVVGSYYVQAQRLEAAAWWASIVPGILTTLVLYHHQFLHWRADKAAGKMTPVAVLGPEIAIVVSGVAIVAAYVVLTLQVAFELFPPTALLALLTGVPLAASWGRAARDTVAQNCLNLLGATLGASVLTGLIVSLSLGLVG